MSDKISGFTVVFESDVSQEYMDTVKQMVGSIKHVVSIEPVISSTSMFIGESKERTRIVNFLINSIQSDFK